jgi:signal transduction histidine kinase
VQGDRVRLQQVFWNLVRNAIKFTPAGGRIEIAASCRAGEAVVRVSDNGIGIPPDQLERIFAAFEQGRPDTAARFGGLGLGLAICRLLTEAHGGRVTADSAGPNQGAAFTVTLPASPRAAATLPAA